MTTNTMQELINMYHKAYDDKEIEAFDAILIKLEDCDDEDKQLATELFISLKYSDAEIQDLINNA